METYYYFTFCSKNPKKPLIFISGFFVFMIWFPYRKRYSLLPAGMDLFSDF